MRVATWNIYWLGNQAKIQRSESDHKLIAQVIRHVKPDVLALEEIVDPVEMEQILALANGEGVDYRIKSSDSNWFTSDSHPTDSANPMQKPFLCINNATVEVIKGASVRGASGRRPYAMQLRERSSGKEFVAVGMHLRSGFPDFLDADDAAARAKEVESLVKWLQGESVAENNSFPKPGLDDVVIMGDFNAEMDDVNKSLDPLKNGAMAQWSWTKPIPDAGHWETALYENDHFVIDFILFSKSLAQKVVLPPTIYAWDHDAAMGGSTTFHDGPNGSGKLKGYGVSDHRLVYADVEL